MSFRIFWGFRSSVYGGGDDPHSVVVFFLRLAVCPFFLPEILKSGLVKCFKDRWDLNRPISGAPGEKTLSDVCGPVT